MSDGGAAITQLLKSWRQGNPAAMQQLMPLVYDQLRRLSRRCMNRERPDHPPDPSALGHEASPNLLGKREVEGKDRAPFFAVAATAMRCFLVDPARRKGSAKRGSDPVRVSLDHAGPIAASRLSEVIEL